MESWRALMIPITGDSSGPNGFGAIVTSDSNPRALNFSIIDIITTAALKVRLPYSPSKRMAISQSCRLQSSHCRTLTTFQTERSLSFALSEVTESSISSENILNFLRLSSILMCELNLLPICIKFRSTLVTIWLLLSLTNYRHGSLQILRMGNRCIGTS